MGKKKNSITKKSSASLALVPSPSAGRCEGYMKNGIKGNSTIAHQIPCFIPLLSEVISNRCLISSLIFWLCHMVRCDFAEAWGHTLFNCHVLLYICSKKWLGGSLRGGVIASIVINRGLENDQKCQRSLSITRKLRMKCHHSSRLWWINAVDAASSKPPWDVDQS